jgi:hypothetical protein
MPPKKGHKNAVVAKANQKASNKFKITKKDLSRRKSKDSDQDSDADDDNISGDDVEFEEDYEDDNFSKQASVEISSNEDDSEEFNEPLLVKRDRRSNEVLKKLIIEQELNFPHGRTKKVA